MSAIGSVPATARKVLARQHGEPLRDVALKLPEAVERVAPSELGDLWPGEEKVVTGARAAAPTTSRSRCSRAKLGRDRHTRGRGGRS